jgi:integrase/recombinase XerD
MGAALDAYLAELERRRYSSSLLARARHVLPRFFSHLRERGVSDLRAVTEAHVEGHARLYAQRKTRYGRPPTLTTRALNLSMLRRFFAFLERRRWILLDPARQITLPRPDTLPRVVLSQSQAQRLMGIAYRFNGRWWWPHVETRDHAILELLYGTGIRLGECVRLDVADVDLLEEQLLVRNGKGRKDRVVPIPHRALLALDAYLRDARPAFLKDPREAALFVTWEGKRLTPITLRVMVQRRARAAKLPLVVSPHVLRHSCATHLLRGGADVRHVQEILGHAEIDSTMRYTRVAVADLAQVLERSHPREREWARRYNQSHKKAI